MIILILIYLSLSLIVDMHVSVLNKIYMIYIEKKLLYIKTFFPNLSFDA